ncbi:uncharacterized protein [Haliotis cracherodii]|uniref:uncharacterized protein n=1 Tax=Haliotis cracherodii TaxID=6455 RepID=UPI0039ECC805
MANLRFGPKTAGFWYFQGRNSTAFDDYESLYRFTIKKLTSINSFPYVTLLSVLYTVFEAVIDKRISQFQGSTSFPDGRQCGFQKRLSSSHASFTIQESAQHYIERGNTQRAVMLDSAKAFDTVWHDILPWELHLLDIPGPIWRLLSHCFDGMKCCILVNNVTSYWFELKKRG